MVQYCSALRYIGRWFLYGKLLGCLEWDWYRFSSGIKRYTSLRESTPFSSSSLVQSSLRFSITYIGISQVVGLYLEPGPGASSIWFGVTGDSSILSIFGARVMLNLKVEGEKSLQQGTSRRTKSTLPGIDFAEHSLDDRNSRLDESRPDTNRSEAIEIEEVSVWLSEHPFKLLCTTTDSPRSILSFFLSLLQNCLYRSKPCICTVSRLHAEYLLSSINIYCI